MKQCPVCKNWTLDFDSHFGRFRCLDTSCGWMPVSSAERELKLLRSRGAVQQIGKTKIPGLGLVLSSHYDRESDALVFDFGLDEPTFDLPEDDGIMVWSMGRRSGCVAGFSIFRAKELAFGEITVKIAARKIGIEEAMKRFPRQPSTGRASRLMVEQVLVSAKRPEEKTPQAVELQNAVKENLAKFREMIAQAP